jgi:YgiT-type zinc finger domain-containing protein
MNKECNVCHGKLEHALTTYTQHYKGRLIVVENVPAWICEQCGETYYDPDIVDRLQTLIWSEAAPTRIIETPVYDLDLVS